VRPHVPDDAGIYSATACIPPAVAEPTEVRGASASDSRKPWARLLARIYNIVDYSGMTNAYDVHCVRLGP